MKTNNKYTQISKSLLCTFNFYLKFDKSYDLILKMANISHKLKLVCKTFLEKSKKKYCYLNFYL
ncbi:MAG: hypothetical protein RLY43_1445 [Bacteroidota bacterium]